MDNRGKMRLVLLVLVAIAFIFTFVNRDNPLTQSARAYAADVATASAGVYVTLRSLNAVLSTVQEAEVGGSLVVSGSVQPLKALEPIDDTIERVASMVFALMIVTGVVAVAVGPIGIVGLGLIIVALALDLSQRRFQSVFDADALSRTFLRYGCLLALAVPLAFLCASLGGDWMTNEVWLQHQAVIADITGEIEAANPTPEIEQQSGWLSSMRGALDNMDAYRKLAQNVFARADELVQSYVMILGVFAFKLIVLPAVMFWGLFALIRGGTARF